MEENVDAGTPSGSVQVGFLALHAKPRSHLRRQPLPKGTARLEDDASRNGQPNVGPVEPIGRPDPQVAVRGLRQRGHRPIESIPCVPRGVVELRERLTRIQCEKRRAGQHHQEARRD
jgi:hypothetical protein